jgi:hypothetical protein
MQVALLLTGIIILPYAFWITHKSQRDLRNAMRLKNKLSGGKANFYYGMAYLFATAFFFYHLINAVKEGSLSNVILLLIIILSSVFYFSVYFIALGELEK